MDRGLYLDELFADAVAADGAADREAVHCDHEPPAEQNNQRLQNFF